MYMEAPAGFGKTLRLSRDHGNFYEGFFNRGKTYLVPLFNFFKKTFELFSKFLTFCGHGLGGLWFFPGSRVLLVTIRALSTLSILFSISLFHDFTFLICPFGFYCA